jgi:hypothetical protein
VLGTEQMQEGRREVCQVGRALRVGAGTERSALYHRRQFALMQPTMHSAAFEHIEWSGAWQAPGYARWLPTKARVRSGTRGWAAPSKKAIDSTNWSVDHLVQDACNGIIRGI